MILSRNDIVTPMREAFAISDGKNENSAGFGGFSKVIYSANHGGRRVFSGFFGGSIKMQTAYLNENQRLADNSVKFFNFSQKSG
ncbi:hypothetical protein KIF53_17805 [Chromobacterium subtsugae]|uniref:Uncharacterized protein n=3 Tax=Chromobacterium TaxID=535 RepID=A0ABS7FHD0_9NEIS|nr:hypothetical protein [Chromobacterium subtsugae]MBW7568133.1 hypothetical protein [Chromobacterium subtsugae]MBW8289493.1 hypothetical protein [Chromobacterium subtsugae]WSE92045.1 hypothetical protein U6115_02005 [Chromobacterium subtsugae]WVH60419.1 hypothetical protein U6151_02005 [Chromobacterium subtsugae]